MTVRPGQYGSLIASASQTLGGAAGRTFGLNNSEWAVLPAVAFTLVTTATAGTRVMTVRVLDAAGNNLVQIPAAGVGPSGTQRFNFLAGMQASAGNNNVGVAFGVELPIPVNASIQIFDLANIDPADALSLVAAVFAM